MLSISHGHTYPLENHDKQIRIDAVTFFIAYPEHENNGRKLLLSYVQMRRGSLAPG